MRPHVKSGHSLLLHNLSVTLFDYFQESEQGEKRAVMQTQRELRFLSFASVEYEGQIYMTPQDFLESVTEEVPRRKFLSLSVCMHSHG